MGQREVALLLGEQQGPGASMCLACARRSSRRGLGVCPVALPRPCFHSGYNSRQGPVVGVALTCRCICICFFPLNPLEGRGDIACLRLYYPPRPIGIGYWPVGRRGCRMWVTVKF